MMNVEEIVVAATAFVGAVTMLIKNTRDISNLKKYACYRNPCPERITGDALESKSSGVK